MAGFKIDGNPNHLNLYFHGLHNNIKKKNQSANNNGNDNSNDLMMIVVRCPGVGGWQ